MQWCSSWFQPCNLADKNAHSLHLTIWFQIYWGEGRFFTAECHQIEWEWLGERIMDNVDLSQIEQLTCCIGIFDVVMSVPWWWWTVLRAVFWGGREGFQSLLNTNVHAELSHMASFFRMVVGKLLLLMMIIMMMNSARTFGYFCTWFILFIVPIEYLNGYTGTQFWGTKVLTNPSTSPLYSASLTPGSHTGPNGGTTYPDEVINILCCSQLFLYWLELIVCFVKFMF